MKERKYKDLLECLLKVGNKLVHQNIEIQVRSIQSVLRHVHYRQFNLDKVCKLISLRTETVDETDTSMSSIEEMEDNQKAHQSNSEVNASDVLTVHIPTLHDYGIKSPIVHGLLNEYVKKEQGHGTNVASKSSFTSSEISAPSNSKLVRKKIKVNELSGNILLPNEFNFGTRVEKQRRTFENTTMEVVGYVTNHIDFISQTEAKKYPFVALPFEGTPILNYQQYSGITGGVAEPVLYYALLEKLRLIHPDVQVVKDITLPIRHRNYGYKPDIAIIWKERNLYIDVEVDEPYDLLSRKPIHYRKCVDKLRNTYFLDNGWHVVRIAESQIVESLDQTVDYILNFICTVTDDIRFKRDDSLEKVTRWSYDEAVEMERNSYREKLLGLECASLESTIQATDEDYNTIQNFEFVRPDTDIFENRYQLIQEKIQSVVNQYKFLIISHINEQYDYVTKIKLYSFIQKDCEYGIELKDIIEKKKFFLPFKLIGKICGKDVLYKAATDKENNKLIYDAMLHCNPIHIEYRNSQNIESSRNVIALTPWYTELYDEEHKKQYPIEKLLDRGVTDMYVTLARFDCMNYFSGYCTERKEIRTFNTSRIVSLSIYDCKKSAHTFDLNTMWSYLEEDLGKEAEMLYQNLPQKKQSELAFLGNYCNALVMQGRIEEAIDIYISHDVNTIVMKGINWHDASMGDLAYFEECSKFKDSFSETIRILHTKGW